jgi:hypothetical protein
MATWKSQPRNMVFEGKVQVLDKFIVYHRNIGASNTAKVLVYGVMGHFTVATRVYQLLVGDIDTSTTKTVGGTITVASEGYWWYCAIAGTITPTDKAARNYTAGQFFYLETDAAVSGGSSAFHPVSGVELNKGGTNPTGTVLQAAYSPCQSIMYEVSDVENLKNLYSALMTFKVSTDLDDSGS